MSYRAHQPFAGDARDPGTRAFDALLSQLVEAAAERAAEIVLARLPEPAQVSGYVTITEAAEILRCRRQRVDDLLSAGKLARVKEGSRTLIRRAEIATYLARGGDTQLTPSAETAFSSRFAR